MDDQTIVSLIADGLDASTDGRGVGSEHLAAFALANAAPTMLEALECLLEADAILDDSHYPAMDEAREVGRAAIAMARGKA